MTTATLTRETENMAATRPRSAHLTDPGVRAKAQAAKQRAKVERAKQPLRRDFLDADYWTELAKERGVRLPNWDTAVTPGRLANWLRRLGVSLSRYYAWSAERSRWEYARNNPDWPLRAWAGLVLEWLENGAI